MLTDHAHGDLAHFADSRPVDAETVATERAIAMCRATRRADVHRPPVVGARAGGLRGGARRGAAPLRRDAAALPAPDRRALPRARRRALRRAAAAARATPIRRRCGAASPTASIDTIASDHAPWTRELKLDPKLDVAHCRSGRGRARHDAAAALHGGRRDRTAVAGALRRADRRPTPPACSACTRARGRSPSAPTPTSSIWETRERRTIRDDDLFSRARPQRLRRARAARLAARHHPPRRGGVRGRARCSASPAAAGRSAAAPTRAAADARRATAPGSRAASARVARARRARRALRRARPLVYVDVPRQDRPAPRRDVQPATKTRSAGPSRARGLAAGGAARRRADRGRRAATRSTACARRASSPMEQLTLDIGRRPHPTPAPTGTRRRDARDPGRDRLQPARPHPARVERRRPVHRPGSRQHQRHLRRRQAHAGPGAAARRRRAVPRLAGAGVPHRARRPSWRRCSEDAAAPFAPLPTCSPEPGGDLRQAAAASRAPTRRSCSSARPASARRCSRTRSTRTAAAPGKLVAINCAAIPRELVESELFGYEKGAHSTAQGRKVGLVEAGRRRHAVPRRDRRHAARAAVEAAALPAGPALHAARIDARRRGRRPHRRRHQPHRAARRARTCRRRCWAGWARSRSCCRRCATASRTSGAWSRTSCASSTDGRAFEPEAFHALCLHAWPLNVRELSKVIDEAEALSRGAPTIGLEHLPDAVTATLQLDGEDDLENTDVDPAPPPRRRPPASRRGHDPRGGARRRACAGPRRRARS